VVEQVRVLRFDDLAGHHAGDSGRDHSTSHQ
jgi:hypothetical protein